MSSPVRFVILSLCHASDQSCLSHTTRYVMTTFCQSRDAIHMICCDMRVLTCTLYTHVCCNCAVSALDPSHRLHRRLQMAKVSSSQSQRGRLCGSCSGLCYRTAAQQLIAFKLACGVSCRFSSGQGQIYERQPQVWPVILELAPVQRN